jgi:flagellar motor switch protein FliG
MSVYSRFKKDPEGFRQLIELLEAAPASKRQKMIDVGMEEDAEYTKKALRFVLDFKDVLSLSDVELAEVISESPARFTGLAIYAAGREIQQRFLSLAQARQAPEIKEVLSMENVSKGEIGGGQMKLIETTRKLERRGLIKKKKIPLHWKDG